MARLDAGTDPLTATALRSLKDIVEPQPVSWFPQTWGWQVVGFILLAALLFFCVRRLRRYRANRYRREALSALKAVEHDIRDPRTRRRAMQTLTAILKRVALAAWPRVEVAALSGSAWVAFLRQNDAGETGQSLATILDDLEYRGDEGLRTLPLNLAGDVVAAARKWIEHHHVSA